MPGKWRIRLSKEAEQDFVHILQTTKSSFGERRVDVYTTTLVEALAALEDGPEVLGSVARNEIVSGLRSLHVARGRRRGRHFIMYRTSIDQTIEVLRILYDAMDFARHIPPEADSDDDQ